MKKLLAVACLTFISVLLWTAFSLPFARAQSDSPEQVLFLPLLQNNFDPGWQWERAEVVTFTPSPMKNPLMAIDRSGQVHLFWDTWSSSKAAFIYHSVRSETGWSNPTPVAQTLGVSQTLIPPAVTPDGRVHIVWYNQLASGGPYRLMYARYDGNEWSPEEELARFANPYPKAALSQDGQGNLNFVYQEPTILSYRYYQRIHTPDGWSEPVDITPDTDSQIILWNVWPDRSGGVRFYGRDLDDHLVYSYWDNGAFQSDMQPIPDAEWLNSSILDAGDNLHLYQVRSVPVPGGNVEGLHHRCLDSGLSWGEEQVLSGSDPAGRVPTPAVDDRGGVVFGWKQYGSASFKLALLDGCSEPVLQSGRLPDSTYWGYLSAVALSANPGKVCVLVEIPYYSHTQGIKCAAFME